MSAIESDEAWLKALQDRHGADLYRFAASRGLDSRDVEEVVSDAWQAAYEHRLDGLQPRNGWRAYLFGIVRHKATDRSRSLRLWYRSLFDLPEDLVAFDRGVDTPALWDDLVVELRKLPERERLCVVLPAYDFADAEIAVMIGVTVDNVRTIRSRTSAKLRAAYRANRRPVASRAGRGAR